MKVLKPKLILRRAAIYSFLCILLASNTYADNGGLFSSKSKLEKPAGKTTNETNELTKQEIIITGTVTDSKGEPLPGVNIVVEGTTIGVITDVNGHYSINVPGEKSVVIFSYVGYLTEKVTVGQQRVIDMKLVEDIKQLNEVVVTALGLKREEKSLGYAVSSITAKDITLTGTTNFASALYGKAAGVRINAANGGASSAVNIQIRGVASINNNTQPLYVVDGVPIRNQALLNTASASNNASFWDEQRVRENGILDINPQDIESLTVLKGASASALYGSEAANGVVVITTKKGTQSKKGMGVDFSYQYDVEQLAFQPDYQNEYGPGYDRESNLAITGTEEGWITESDGSVHPYYGAYGEFGPKFDGSTVKYWDGSTRKYNAQPNNYKDFFDKGYNSNFNFAFSNGNEKGNYRFAYTRTDYKSIMPGSKLNKNYFNFNGTLKLHDKVSVDLVSNYINSYTHNRPYMMNQLFQSFSGFFSRFDDMSVYFNKYQTTKGYKWVPYDNTKYDQNEALLYRIRATNVLDYLWTQLRNSYDEYQDRYINSATLNIDFTSKLKLRGRIGNDFTSVRVEKKEYAQYPSAFGTTGSYNIQNGRYSLLYGDALLSYTDHLTSDLGITLTGGVTGKQDTYNDLTSGTNGGLVLENWFNLGNSASNQSTSGSTQKQAYMAGFGIAEFSYKNWLFLQGTGRYESTSTLPPKSNSYFYPSFNGSFIFSDVIHLPSFISYGKLRASWGIVGNHPERYQANVAYNQGTTYPSTGSAIYLYPNSSQYGNDKIKSEKKYESEFGLEASLFENKLHFDFSYYNNKIVDQILYLSTAASVGSTSILTNVGDLTNRGVEISVNATPLRSTNFRWDVRFNYAFNQNRLDKLMEGVKYLEMYNADGGSLLIRAAQGDALGDIYVHPILTNSSGEKIVTDGYYSIDYDNYTKVGNVTPKAIGGFSNTFTYKGFSLDFLVDYKLGGDLVSLGMHYMTGAGMFENTLKYRDAAHGGLSYRIDGNTKVLDANGSYHDGIVLDGATDGGSANTTVIDAASYYLNTFGWGTYSGVNNLYENAVHKNSYIKMREITLSYSLPKSMVQKIGFQNMQISIIGKNLFYIWKTLPNNWDPESATGSSWLYQGIDQGAAAPTRSLGVSLRASF